MQIDCMVSEIFKVFSNFPGETFSTWKMETKLCVSSTLIIIRKQFSNCLNSFGENWLQVFPLKLEKLEKKAKMLWKKNKFVLFPAHRLRDPLA